MIDRTRCSSSPKNKPAVISHKPLTSVHISPTTQPTQPPQPPLTIVTLETRSNWPEINTHHRHKTSSPLFQNKCPPKPKSVPTTASSSQSQQQPPQVSPNTNCRPRIHNHHHYFSISQHHTSINKHNTTGLLFLPKTQTNWPTHFTFPTISVLLPPTGNTEPYSFHKSNPTEERDKTEGKKKQRGREAKALFKESRR